MGDQSEVNYQLHCAVREGDLKEIQNLIDHYGLSYLPHWSQGYVFLSKSTKLGRTKVAKLLLRNGCRVNNKSGNPIMTPLHFAAEKCDVELVEMLLDKGAHVNAKTKDGETPLAFAVRRGDSIVAEHLLNHGATVDVTSTSSNLSSETFLHIACKKGNEKLVELLLRNHVHVNATDQNGSTPLHIAVHCGNLKVVEQLLIYGADIDSTCILGGKKGVTALHVAAKTGNEEIIKLLLSKGSTVDAQNEDNSTPLHIAIENYRATAARIYLEHGADVNAKRVDNQTPLNLAAETSHGTIIRDILRYKPDPSDEHNRLALCSAVRKRGSDSEKIVADLLDYGLAVSPRDIINGSLLHAAVENGYEKIVEDLLKYGADANYSVTDTWRKSSLLHIAVGTGQDSIINSLLNYGADVNNKDSTGRTPIYLAVANRHLRATELLLDNKAQFVASFDLHPLHRKSFSDLVIESRNTKVVEILLRYNVNVNAVDENGTTVLHVAVKRNYTKMVKLLLDYGADVNSVSEGHKTPLHSAVSNENKSITTMLLDKGANVNAAEANGLTALYVACSRGCTEVVEILLKYGAESSCVENKDAIPLHAATINKHEAVVEILLRYDADIDLRNDNGLTALHIASQQGSDKIFHILLEHGSDINCVTKDNYTALQYSSSYGRERFDEERMYQIHFQRYEDNYIDEDNYCIDYDVLNHDKLSNHLQCHMIKLKAANLYLNEKDIRSINIYKFWRFRTDCEKEIENMRSEKISDNISFYDILTKGIGQLSAYARNENVMQALTTDDYKTKFPIYASMINLQFEKGIKRNDLLEQSYRSLDILCDSFPMLPHLCVDKILTYLSNYDLRNLINASKATNISHLTK